MEDQSAEWVWRAGMCQSSNTVRVMDECRMARPRDLGKCMCGLMLDLDINVQSTLKIYNGLAICYVVYTLMWFYWMIKTCYAICFRFANP